MIISEEQIRTSRDNYVSGPAKNEKLRADHKKDAGQIIDAYMKRKISNNSM